MKKTFNFLFVCFLTLALASTAMAFSPSDTTINTQVRNSQQHTEVCPDLLRHLVSTKSFSTHGVDLVTVTPDGKRVWSIKGNLSSPLHGDLKVAAKEYLKENSKLFNVPLTRNVEVKESRYESHQSFKHIGFQMEIDGLPVHESDIQLHIDKEGVVRLVNGSFPIIENIDNHVALTKYQAIGAAKNAIGAQNMRAVPQADLTIFPTEDNGARVAYAAKIAVENPIGDWKVIVDAQNADILYINNEMAFRTGKGAAYVLHPLASEVTIEPMPNLTHNTLRGLYANIINDNGTNSFSEEDTHIYDIDSEHFNESNMYYYVNQIHSFFKSLGHDKHDTPMRAIVNLGTNYDNAYFSPWQGLIAFGNGNRFNDLAREAAVAYHEYSHAVLHSVVYLVYSGEAGAINEGQADYFACSFTENSRIGEYVTAKMDNMPYLRDLCNNYIYPDDIAGQVHHDGKIWGGTLWDIRTALGASTADRLIYRSHYFLRRGRANFMDAAKALVIADEELNDGKNIKVLEQIFADRGIIAENYFGRVVTGEQLSNLHRFNQLHGE